MSKSAVSTNKQVPP